MISTTRTLLLVLSGFLAGVPVPAVARDPGPIDATGRGPTSALPRDRYVPPDRRVPTALQRPAKPPAERRRLYERVEEDVDRGAGRIEDEQAYDARLRQQDQDERLGRIKPERETQRFQEEYDRQLRIEARERRERGVVEARQADGSIVTPLPDRPTSVLSRVVAEDEKRLDALRVRYQSDLRGAESERDEAIRAAKTADARSVADRRFIQRRSELTRGYQAERRRILGTK